MDDEGRKVCRECGATVDEDGSLCETCDHADA